MRRVKRAHAQEAGSYMALKAVKRTMTEILRDWHDFYVLMGMAAATGARSGQAITARQLFDASFQVRSKASCMPVFMPWPPAGLWMWAASPASNGHVKASLPAVLGKTRRTE